MKVNVMKKSSFNFGSYPQNGRMKCTIPIAIMKPDNTSNNTSIKDIFLVCFVIHALKQGVKIRQSPSCYGDAKEFSDLNPAHHAG